MECCKMGLKTFFQYSNIPGEKTFLLVCAVLFALCSSSETQQAKKIPRSEAQEFGLGKTVKKAVRIRFFSSHPPRQTAATSENA